MMNKCFCFAVRLQNFFVVVLMIQYLFVFLLFVLPFPRSNGRRLRFIYLGDPLLESLIRVKKMNFCTNRRQALPIFATFLNAPCTALCLSQTDRNSTIYLVVGKANGETVFFPTDRTECVSKFENEEKVPISAIASGDLRNLSKPELVTITTSGTLTSLSFPCGAANGPVCLYAQQLYPNICSAELLDIDRDGLVELVVVMTDRVVRSYRYVEELARMIPLNKWEMPTHISGWAIGLDRSNFALLSQLEEHNYVRLEFGPTKEVYVLKISDGHHQQQTTTIDPSAADRPFVPPSLTQLVVPKRPFAVHLLHSMAQRIALVDEGSKPSTEVELHNPDGADIACACATTLSSQLRIVVTVDSWGQLSIYAWRDGDQQQQQQQQKSCEPVVSCRVMRDADHVCCCGGPRTYDERLFVGVVNVFNRVAILSVDLGHISHEN